MASLLSLFYNWLGPVVNMFGNAKATWSKPAIKDAKIIIIGAGMGGLAAALALAKKGFTNIEVYESAQGLGFVGAGIQLGPNLVRVLTRLECWADIERGATDIQATSIRDGQSNNELAHIRMPHIREKYGAPHCTSHRAAVAKGLYDGCKKEPAIKFHFGHTLVSVDAFDPKPLITLQPHQGSPKQLQADILLGADGIKSVTRSHLLNQTGYSVEAEDTGQAAYRIMLKREDMAGDPEMMALLDSNQSTRWIGEKRHWICYPIQSRTIYNMSSIQPDTNFAQAPISTYTTKGSKTAMLQVFSDFCPLVQRMLNLVPEGEVCEWKLRAFRALPTWVHGSAALLGDACHPTLPHLNQGAGMAVEDAAVLAEVLAQAPSAEPRVVERCLKVYELCRKERTTTLVDLAAMSGKALHLGAGQAKEERDRQFKQGGKIPDKWASPEVQEMIYGHDCMRDAEKNFPSLYNSLLA